MATFLGTDIYWSMGAIAAEANLPQLMLVVPLQR